MGGLYIHFIYPHTNETHAFSFSNLSFRTDTSSAVFPSFALFFFPFVYTIDGDDQPCRAQRSRQAPYSRLLWLLRCLPQMSRKSGLSRATTQQWSATRHLAIRLSSFAETITATTTRDSPRNVLGTSSRSLLPRFQPVGLFVTSRVMRTNTFHCQSRPPPSLKSSAPSSM